MHRGLETFQRDFQKRPSKETFKRDLQKRHRKETYVKAKECAIGTYNRNYERDLRKLTKETHKRDLQNTW